jgi:hypothetical protein
LAFTGLGGFRFVECPKSYELLGRPSPDLSLPSRVPLALEPPSRTYLARLPSLRFFPLRRLPDDGQPLTPGLPAPWVPFPSQRFSRSQGLAPPTTCRPCFVPVPPMGFPFRADFHPQSRTSSRTPLPSCGWPAGLHFRVLLPASVSRFRKKRSSGNSDPPGVHLPRGVSLFAVVRNHPLLSFMAASRSWLATALQSIGGEKVGLALSSLPPLSRFFHLVDNPVLCREAGSGLLLGSSVCRHAELFPLRAQPPGCRSFLGCRLGDGFQGSCPGAVARFGGLSSRGTDGFSSPRSSPPLLGLARFSEDIPEEASGLVGFSAPSLALACAGL